MTSVASSPGDFLLRFQMHFICSHTSTRNFRVPFMPRCACQAVAGTLRWLLVTSIFLLVSNLSSCCQVSCSLRCLLKRNSTCICKRMLCLSEDQQDFCPSLPVFAQCFPWKGTMSWYLESVGKEERFIPPGVLPVSRIY